MLSLGHHVLATLSGNKQPAYLAEVNDHFNKRHQAHAEKEPHIATKRTWNRVSELRLRLTPYSAH